MTYTFRKAIASEAKPLVGLYAESGCGKTYGALLLAKGFTGDMSRVLMIETESGRGEAWADDEVVGGYNVLPLRSEFSPRIYGAAIREAEEANMQALIVDSASHEWEGVGGVLSMAADNEEAGKKGPLVWQKPKIDHQREFMLRLTQTPIPLVIVCMRAKYAMEQKTINGKKEWARSSDLSPKQSDDILSEMFVHGWIDRDHKFRGTKYTVNAMRAIFLDGERITVDTGRRLADWAARASKPSAPSSSPPAILSQQANAGTSGADLAGEYVSADQVIYLETACQDNGVPIANLKHAAKVERLAMILAQDYGRACTWLDAAVAKRKATA